MAATKRLATQRERGGKVDDGADVVSGNPNVFKEAARKKGGKVKKKAAGGKIVGLMTGGAPPMRSDKASRGRPNRNTGGKVGTKTGANTSPLSTAHNVSGGTSGSSNPTDTYGGKPA